MQSENNNRVYFLVFSLEIKAQKSCTSFIPCHILPVWCCNVCLLVSDQLCSVQTVTTARLQITGQRVVLCEQTAIFESRAARRRQKRRRLLKWDIFAYSERWTEGDEAESLTSYWASCVESCCSRVFARHRYFAFHPKQSRHNAAHVWGFREHAGVRHR